MTADSDPAYFCQDWHEQSRASRSPLWKRGLYWVIRPVLSQRMSRHLGDEYRHQSLRYVIGSRGMPIEARRAWVNDHHRLRGATLLIQGTGTGWDVVSWAKYRPATIYAVDLFTFPEWKQVSTYIKQQYGVRVLFIQSSLNALPLSDHCIDVIVSDAVFEHCTNMGQVLAESRRVIAPAGILYATYGPLWYCAGGDHFSGRGGLEHTYNHVRLDPERYRAYFERNRQPVENFQSGGRYVELDLFAKMTTREYMAAFEEAGFDLAGLILELSPDALNYQAAYPTSFTGMVDLIDGISIDDLLLKANFVILRPV